MDKQYSSEKGKLSVCVLCVCMCDVLKKTADAKKKSSARKKYTELGGGS